MAKTRTANFEVQIEREDGTLVITGAMTKRDSIQTFRELAPVYNSTQGYIWGQTAYGRRILKNADYIGLCLQDGKLEIYTRTLEDDSAAE